MLKNDLHSIYGMHRLAVTVAFAAGFIIASHPLMAQQNTSAPVTIEASTSLEWDQSKGVYTAIGDAFVEQADTTLAGDKIIALYDPKSESRDLQHVTAIGAVVYKDGESTARGAKLDYDITAETYILAGPQASIIGQRGTMTASQSITYEATDPSRKRVVGLGDAIYRGDDGRRVEGDRVVAFLNADGAVDTIDSYGNAKVVTPKGIIATADTLNYVAETDRAELFGDVEVIDQDNIMRGARAEVEFDKEISRLLSDGSGKRVTGVLTPN